MLQNAKCWWYSCLLCFSRICFRSGAIFSPLSPPDKIKHAVFFPSLWLPKTIPSLFKYVSHVDPSVLDFSLSFHRHPRICILVTSLVYVVHNKISRSENRYTTVSGITVFTTGRENPRNWYSPYLSLQMTFRIFTFHVFPLPLSWISCLQVTLPFVSYYTLSRSIKDFDVERTVFETQQ